MSGRVSDRVSGLLSVDRLNVTFDTPRGPRRVVREVSFALSQGEVLGIVGESGSGKSVTLRAVMGLLRPPTQVTGSVRRRGVDLLEMPRQRRRSLTGGDLSMIFQEPMTALNPVLSVGEQIWESLLEHSQLRGRAAQSRAAELLDLVGIPSPKERLRAYPHEFSGGMRQRAMIAIALASSPHLLLADEPTTALDVTIQDQILKLLLKLRDTLSMSVVLVTHDLGVVAQTCDRVAVMYAGRIAEKAPVREIFRRPKHAYTLGLRLSLPEGGTNRQPLKPIPGAPPDPSRLPPGCPFAPRCAYATPACREAEPPLMEVLPNHSSACINHAALPAPEEVVA